MARMSRFINGHANRPHTPNLLWGGLPRDRRGRVVQKQKQKQAKGLAISGGEEGDMEDAGDAFGDGAETPRNGLAVDVEREREFLESLR